MISASRQPAATSQKRRAMAPVLWQNVQVRKVLSLDGPQPPVQWFDDLRSAGERLCWRPQEPLGPRRSAPATDLGATPGTGSWRIRQAGIQALRRLRRAELRGSLLWIGLPGQACTRLEPASARGAPNTRARYRHTWDAELLIGGTPQHEWTSFAPPGWTNFAPPLTVPSAHQFFFSKMASIKGVADSAAKSGGLANPGVRYGDGEIRFPLVGGPESPITSVNAFASP